MNLYVVRHGETDWNIQGRMQGSTDILLNKNGIKQAYLTKEKLKNIQFDICYCSTLERSKKTAEIIIDNRCPIIFSKLFDERYMGTLEGSLVKSFEDLLKYWDINNVCNDNNIENVNDVLKRAKEALDFIDKSYENVLVVSHGAFIKAFNFVLEDSKNSDDIVDFRLENCEYKVYKI